MRIGSLKFPWQWTAVLRKSFLVAVLCHVSVLGIFIFTFNIPAGAHKPVFVFLGSLLTNRDFSSLSLGKAVMHKKIMPAVLELSGRRETAREDSYALISKPVYSALLSQPEKITMKPAVTTGTPPKPDTNKQKSQKQDGKGSSVFPYVPLRLYNK